MRANLTSIFHRCYLFELAFVWELAKEIIHLPLGCLQGGVRMRKGEREGGRERGRERERGGGRGGEGQSAYQGGPVVPLGMVEVLPPLPTSTEQSQVEDLT